MLSIIGGGLHISTNTLVVIALVLAILVLAFYLFGRFRH
jgi:hypothetical protein